MFWNILQTALKHDFSKYPYLLVAMYTYQGIRISIYALTIIDYIKRFYKLIAIRCKALHRRSNNHVIRWKNLSTVYYHGNCY